jgi:copper chaperone CopZ
MSATTTYRVSGMTCGHCVSAVTEELTKLDGVTAVDIDLVAGGTSPVHVVSDAPLDEAGYALADA